MDGSSICPLVPAGTLYGERLNQLDLRFVKLLRYGRTRTGVNLGLIRKLGGPYSLLLAGGPSFSGGQTSYHSYAALALNF